MKLSTKVFLGFFTLLTLLAVVYIFYYRLSEQVNKNISWLAKSESIIRMSGKLHREIIDMENSFRGYLLTGNENFLFPYKTAQREIPLLFKELRAELHLKSRQAKRLDSIQSLHNYWVLKHANRVIKAKENSILYKEALPKYEYLLNNELRKGIGKRMTDEIKVKFLGFNRFEYDLRQRRNYIVLSSVAYTRNATLGITILSFVIGLACAFYITKTLSNRINKMVKLAGRISAGNFLTPIDDRQNDELSDLSKSLDKMAITLNESFSSLNKKNQELDQFAHIVSHDLKAPLRGIDNVMIWMQEDIKEELPQIAQEYLSMMKTRVLRMENHIEGLLEFSRIGRVKNAKEQVDLKTLLLDIVDMYSTLSKIKVHIPEVLPVIYTEKVYLQQVFSNLISNGIKHHNKEEGIIEIQFEEFKDHYVFKVIDDGPGIEPEYHEKIFVMFQTLKERDAFESNGVGLAIVKKVLEENNGSIKVISELGKGSTFVITWPKYNTI